MPRSFAGPDQPRPRISPIEAPPTVPGEGVRVDLGAVAPLGEEDEPPLDIREGLSSTLPGKSKTSASGPRAMKPSTDDKFTQEDAVKQDWTTFDVKHVLGRLWSDKEEERLRALRILHIKWWHCGPTQMRKILGRAGLPNHVLEMAERVAQSCTLCAKWQKPGYNAKNSGEVK